MAGPGIAMWPLNREALPCPPALEIRRTAGISASQRCTPPLNEAVVGSIVEGDLTIAGVHHGEALPGPNWKASR